MPNLFPIFFTNVSTDLFIYFEDIGNLCLPLNSSFDFSIDGFSSCMSACNTANVLFSFLQGSLIIMSLLLCFAMIELQASPVVLFLGSLFSFFILTILKFVISRSVGAMPHGCSHELFHSKRVIPSFLSCLSLHFSLMFYYETCKLI